MLSLRPGAQASHSPAEGPKHSAQLGSHANLRTEDTLAGLGSGVEVVGERTVGSAGELADVVEVSVEAREAGRAGGTEAFETAEGAGLAEAI